MRLREDALGVLGAASARMILCCMASMARFASESCTANKDICQTVT